MKTLLSENFLLVLVIEVIKIRSGYQMNRIGQRLLGMMAKKSTTIMRLVISMNMHKIEGMQLQVILHRWYGPLQNSLDVVRLSLKV